MTSNVTACESLPGSKSGESDLTAPNPSELSTGRASAAGAAGRGDESQSETFRALAWSQDNDAVAEPLPYLGGEHEEFTVPGEETADRSAPPRYRRSTLLFGFAVGLTAAAVGGVVLTVMSADTVPARSLPVVIHPAEDGLNAVNAESLQPILQTAPVPARAVSTAATTPPIAVAVPQHTATAITPDAAPPAPVVTAPEAAPPVTVPPVVTPPIVSVPEVTPMVSVPEVTPIVSVPEVTPIVSVPEVTPQPVPHPVGPPLIHVPVSHDLPVVPLPDLGVSVPPIIQVPAAPGQSNPVITLHPVVTLPASIPVLSGGAGR